MGPLHLRCIYFFRAMLILSHEQRCIINARPALEWLPAQFVTRKVFNNVSVNQTLGRVQTDCGE